MEDRFLVVDEAGNVFSDFDTYDYVFDLVEPIEEHKKAEQGTAPEND